MKNIIFNVTDKISYDTKIKISEMGKLKAFDSNKKVYSFLVECDNNKESIHFIFYNSINFTEERDKRKEKIGFASGMSEKDIRALIYNVLACIGMDYYSEDIDLSEFIDNYGYEYSKETEQLFNKVKEQKAKLHKVFTDEQVKLFEENDDLLKNFVDDLTYQKDVKDLI